MSDQKADVAVNSIELATELTVAWLNNPNVKPSTDDALAFLRSMRGEIDVMANAPATPAADAAPDYVPAVSVRASVKPDHLVSLIDGKKYKSLKRHLSANGLTPAEYRQRYGLKADYPMVAASYSAERRAVALKLGLGQKGRAAPAKLAAEPVAAAEAAVTPAKPVRAPAKAKATAAGPKAVRAKAAPEAVVSAEPAKVKPAAAAPKAARGAKVKTAATATTAKAAAAPKTAKPARAAKAAAKPAVEKAAKAAAPKRGWWKKGDAAPAAEAAPAPAKPGRPKKAPVEA